MGKWENAKRAAEEAGEEFEWPGKKKKRRMGGGGVDKGPRAGQSTSLLPIELPTSLLQATWK